MAKRLAIAVIHGIGWQKSDFADEMIEEVNERVDDLDRDSNDIAWQPVHWADILEPRQVAYLSRANADDELDYIGLRRFVVSALGDATAYQPVASETNTTYEKIHERVRENLQGLKDKLDTPETAPLIFMAHSLGGHIMSNYIWDVQQNPPDAVTAFERFETLAGIVTFGSNLPLFTLAYPDADIIPITFPAEQLPQETKDKAKWLNYFDPDDILGYPLKPINGAYDLVVTEDICINVGGLFSSWNPVSHTKYWTDNDFTKPAAEFIASFL